MHNYTIAKLIKGLQNKEFSSVELTQHFLDRISQLNSNQAAISLIEDQSIEWATTQDTNRAQGIIASPLAGIPIAIKDNINITGVKTTCGSMMLENFTSPYTATSTMKLLEAGAIPVAKANMDEFAMGSSTENSAYQTTCNPWNLETIPGGSSGGSAAAMAAGEAIATLGTDTGGSIRQPAALCGVVGMKPTYGLISRYGLVAFASSLDQVGPMARTAEDCAIMLNCMASFDEKDSTSVNQSVPDYTASLGNSIKGLKIGIPKEYFSEGLDPGTEIAVRKALADLEAQGAQLVEISLPNSHLSVPAYYVIAPAEASANLSRFDGVKYGYRCENPKDLQDMYCRSRSEGFGEEVQRRILIGTYVLSSGYYDAYYGKAQQVRKLIQQDFSDAFKSVDLIMGPTCPSPAFKFGAKGDDPVAMYLEDIYTIATNLAGLPGMSVPCGMVEEKPVGLQIIGNYFDEARMLNLAHQFQQVTDWHTQAPEGIS